MKIKRIYKLLGIGVITITLVFLGNSLAKKKTNSNIVSDQSITQTVLKLEAMEKKDPLKAEVSINKVNKDIIPEKFDMSKAKVIFEDVVFLGDSITEYLKEADILTEANVLAKKGERVSQVDKHREELIKLKPKKVVILYGANDIEAYDADKFKEHYKKSVQEIQQIDKNIKIYIQEPLDVNEAISTKNNQNMNNQNVALFSKRAQEVASETGVTFLQSDGLIDDKNLYEVDGIHLKYNFYKRWLNYLHDNI